MIYSTRLCLGFLLVLFSTRVFAQEAELFLNQRDTTKTNSYYSDYTHELTVRAMAQSRQLGMLVSGGNLIKSINYRPNSPLVIGFGFVHKWLGITVGLPIANSEASNQRYGFTKAFDIQAHAYTRNVIISGYYQRYKGYYTDNLRFLQNKVVDSMILRPDIVTQSLGASVIWFLNGQKLSYRAAFVGSEVQRKSAGSFMLSPFFSYFRIKADSNLVLKPYLKAGMPTDEFSRGDFLNMGVNAGYGYTLVFLRKAYIHASGNLGLMLQDQRVENDGKVDRVFQASTSMRFHIAMGVSGRRLFGGLSMNMEAFDQKLEYNTVSTSVSEFRFFLGYRWKVRKDLLPDNPFRWH